MVNAISLAVEEINKTGGVQGTPLVLSTADDRTNPAAGVDAARKMVASDKIHGLIGPLDSSVFQAVAKAVAIPDELPILSAAAGGSGVAALESNGLVFRSGPSDADQGAALAQVAKNKGYRSVGILFLDNDDGKELAESFAKAFTKIGGKVTASSGFSARQADFSAELKKAGAGRSEALLIAAYSRDGAAALKQALDSGAFNKFLLSQSMKAPEVIEAVGGQFLDGVAGAATAVPPDNPGSDVFRQAYQAKYGDLPAKPFLEASYDAVYLIALAAETAKTAKGAKLRDAIREITVPGGVEIGPGQFAKARQAIAQGKRITYVGAAGPLAFDDHGSLIGGGFAQWEIEDGNIHTTRMIATKP